MEKLQIIDVARTAEQNSEWLLGYAIDKPKKGTNKDVAAVDVLGWIVGKKSPAVAVAVMSTLPLPKQPPRQMSIFIHCLWVFGFRGCCKFFC